MADNNDNTSVETGVGSGPAFSIEMGGDNKPEVRKQTAEGATAEFDNDGNVNTHESDKGQGGQEGSEGAQEADSQEAQHDLPAFDANNQEVVEQYATTYIKENGEPNLDALSTAWFKNAKQDASGNWEGALPDDVYTYLDTQGYQKDLVKSVEAGQIALLQQQQTSLYARAGGADNLKKAVEWGKGGGYTEAQRARFNAVVNGKDNAAALDQIDLLMQRFQAATGNGRRAATRVNPRRSVAANAGASGQGGAQGGVQPYATRAEYMADLAKASKANDKALLAESRKRMAVSPWVKGQA